MSLYRYNATSTNNSSYCNIYMHVPFDPASFLPQNEITSTCGPPPAATPPRVCLGGGIGSSNRHRGWHLGGHIPAPAARTCRFLCATPVLVPRWLSFFFDIDIALIRPPSLANDISLEHTWLTHIAWRSLHVPCCRSSFGGLFTIWCMLEN